MTALTDDQDPRQAYSGGKAVDFYFGVGSRYSYLAAARMHLLEQAGASVEWHPLYSPELIRRSGGDPFAPSDRRGQYQAAYRTRDAVRWAAHFGIPYHDPDFDAVDWRTAALWAVAAQALTGSPAMGARLLQRTFGEGLPPGGAEDLRRIAGEAEMPADSVQAMVASGQAAELHAASIERAVGAGAFGVPTFVTSDGELFWGQDRLPLLLDHLSRL